MRNTDGAVHMIAYFCSILNTDPAYIDPFFCWEEGFEMTKRTANLMDDPNEVMYYEFRTVFGVVIAYIAGYLMHCHIEITLSMYEKDGGCEFRNTGNFIHWSADGAKFEVTDGANIRRAAKIHRMRRCSYLGMTRGHSRRPHAKVAARRFNKDSPTNQRSHMINARSECIPIGCLRTRNSVKARLVSGCPNTEFLLSRTREKFRRAAVS
jgi:hypothetical protein